MITEIKHIKHNDINFDKWDVCILSSQNPLVFAQSFYLTATFPNFDALIIGDYECIFPLTQTSKFGISYLHQPAFTPQLGLFGVFDNKIEKLVNDYLLNHFKLIEIELNTSNKFKTAYHTKKTTYIINYSNDFKYNQNTKRNVTKATELGFTCVKINESEIIELSKIYLNPFLIKNLHLPQYSVTRFNALLQSSIKANKLHSFKVIDHNNSLKAIGHFISNGKHTVYLKGLNFDKSDNSGSMHLLMSYAIDYFKQKSDVFDFGGGSKQSLANFYKGFGGQEQEYSFLNINNLPWYIKLAKKIIR